MKPDGSQRKGSKIEKRLKKLFFTSMPLHAFRNFLQNCFAKPQFFFLNRTADSPCPISLDPFTLQQSLFQQQEGKNSDAQIGLPRTSPKPKHPMASLYLTQNQNKAGPALQQRKETETVSFSIPSPFKRGLEGVDRGSGYACLGLGVCARVCYVKGNGVHGSKAFGFHEPLAMEKQARSSLYSATAMSQWCENNEGLGSRGGDHYEDGCISGPP